MIFFNKGAPYSPEDCDLCLTFVAEAPDGVDVGGIVVVVVVRLVLGHFFHLAVEVQHVGRHLTTSGAATDVGPTFEPQHGQQGPL